MCSKDCSEDSRNTIILTHLSGVYESKPRKWKQEGPKNWWDSSECKQVRASANCVEQTI